MPNSDISSVTSNVSVILCSVSAELPNKVETWKLVQVCGMPRRRERAQCRQVTAFERGRKFVFREADLPYRDIAFRTGHAATTVMRVWNQWREEGHTQRWVGTGPCNVTTARDDHHLVGMAEMDCTASSTVLSRRWSTATGLDLFATTVRCRLLRAGLVARMPLRRLPLSRDHQCLRLQWSHEGYHCVAKCSVFGRVPLQNVLQWWPHTCSMLRWWTHSESLHSSAAWGPTPSVMVWGAIVYKMRSRLLRSEGNLNRNRYIREVLHPEILPLLQRTQHAIFQQDNARPHVVRIVQAFFQRHWVSMLPWPARVPHMSPIEHIWDMFGRRLIRHVPPAPTLDALWIRTQLQGGTFPRMISRASLIPCHDA